METKNNFQVSDKHRLFDCIIIYLIFLLYLAIPYLFFNKFFRNIFNFAFVFYISEICLHLQSQPKKVKFSVKIST